MERSKGVERPIKIVTGDRRPTIRLMGFRQGARVGRECCARKDLFLATIEGGGVLLGGGCPRRHQKPSTRCPPLTRSGH